MRQIVSMIRDQTAHFAYVDDEHDELVQFADLLIPDPERFSMIDAAGLGTALIDFLGLNGSKRPVAAMTTVGSGIEARRRAAAAALADAEEADIALSPPPPARQESVAERKRRIARESYHRNKVKDGGTTSNVGRPRRDGQPNQAHPELQAQAYIPWEWCQEVVNQYPEGINARDIGERIWRTKLTTLSRNGTLEYPRWVTRAVENRITGQLQKLKDSGTPLPFAIEYITGVRGNQKTRLLKPLAAGAEPTGPNELPLGDN